MTNHVDIAIVGGGPVGLTLALTLRNFGLRVQLFEANLSLINASAQRTLAISYGSRLILERCAAWPSDAELTPIQSIHVSQRGGFGSTVLTAKEVDVPALGYVVNAHALLIKMNDALQSDDISITTGAKVLTHKSTTSYGSVEFEVDGKRHDITADLIAIADGGQLQAGNANDEIQEKDYHQHAVLAYVETELPHRNMAYERFTAAGPVALLPTGEGFSLVWTTDPKGAKRLLELEPEIFIRELGEWFGTRLGKFTLMRDRKRIPLKLRYVNKVAAQRTVVLGNAAQLLHPVAGQGLNLGMRDAADLAREIREKIAAGIGSNEMLCAYEKRRAADRSTNIFFTDFLVRLYSNDIPPLRIARGIGLASLSCIPSARRFLMRRMLFGAA